MASYNRCSCVSLLLLNITLLSFIHTIVSTNSSLFYGYVEFYCMTTYFFCLFMYFLVSGNLGCFQFFTIMNKDAINILEQILLSLAHIPRNGLLGYRVSICLTLIETTKQFSKGVIPFYVLTRNMKVDLHPHHHLMVYIFFILLFM